ncbi:hypothetical protein BXZ70DRAFT_115533 [Cristinia sonorae]|uniref:Malate dehydrogenase n=1 Tax=Cristinia sonorae TaxID=1940300 RepID=A0A8K0UQT6_9AGAR|nr:hypothetical protein BXZ70DRAFT_115533 [Cristinia sonorae]
MLGHTLSILFLAAAALAAPGPKIARCSVANKQMPMPAGQTQLVNPTAPLSFIGLGLGVQNYTCGSTGTFTSTGAVAELVDISCVDASRYTALTDMVWAVWQKAPKSISIQTITKSLSSVDRSFASSLILGQHYFIPNPITGVGINPKWDFTSASLKGHANAFVVGAKAGNVAAPSNPAANVDWLMLNSIQGDLASQIFRMETRGGQPPSSCTPGTPDISLKYVSQYWFFGGAFSQ